MLSYFIAPTNALSDPSGAQRFCAAELQRLAAISSAKRRDEFIAGHRLLRLAASHILGLDAEREVWLQPEQSAPQLSQHPHLIFGLSHSAGWVAALIETAQTPCQHTRKVGLDIELERARKNLPQLAKYSFTDAWFSLHQDNILPRFFQRWTLCEALVKGSQKPLGTTLLRHQTFIAADTRPVAPDASLGQNSGHWLNHTKINLSANNKVRNSQPPTLHLSLCSQTRYTADLIGGHILHEGKFQSLNAVEYSEYWAQD